jgi:hypothetical protein
MDGAEVVREAEPFLGPVLRCIEADATGERLVIAEDFLKRTNVYKGDVLDAWKCLERLLEDSSVSNADLKGMLNRIDIGWTVQSPFGGDARAAREHLEAARDALQRWTERL